MFTLHLWRLVTPIYQYSCIKQFFSCRLNCDRSNSKLKHSGKTSTFAVPFCTGYLCSKVIQLPFC